MEGLRVAVVILTLFSVNIPNALCQFEYSVDFSSDIYQYEGQGDVPCLSACSCVELGESAIDIFCFVVDIPNWFTDLASNVNLKDYFKYLSIYEHRDDTTVDLPPNAFSGFGHFEDKIDKLHFHNISLGITDDLAFNDLTLKYLLIDISTLAHGNESFWSLGAAIQVLKKSLLELHMIDVRTFDDAHVDLPPLVDFSVLTTVEFRKVPLKYLRSNTFHNLASLIYVSFKECPLVDVSKDAFINVPELAVLEMSSSSLTEIPRFLYNYNLASLQTLSLANSHISDLQYFDFLRTFSTYGIRHLDLQGNLIRTIDPLALETLNNSFTQNLKVLYLMDNPFHCDDDLILFAHWLQSVGGNIDVRGEYNLTEIDDIFVSDAHCIPHCTSVVPDDHHRKISPPECASPEDKKGMSLLSTFNTISTSAQSPQAVAHHKFEYSINRRDKGSSSQLQRIVILSLGTFLALSILLVLFFISIKSFARLVSHFKTYPFQYDVYLSHHNDNIQLVIDKFIPRLEEEPNNMKLRLDFRNLPLGKEKTEQLTNALETSRTTVFLIDNAFVGSDNCMWELHVACSHLLDNNRPAYKKQKGLILIFLDEIPKDALPRKLALLRRKITYLHWEKEMEDNTTAKEEGRWQQLEATLRKVKPCCELMEACYV